MKVLNAAVVDRLLPIQSAIAAMRRALVLAARHPAHSPPRSVFSPDGLPGVLGMMPAYDEETRLIGAKLVSVMPGNPLAGRPTHQGVVVLMCAETGEVLATVDAGAITAIRTPAVSAVATDALAREDARVLGLLGTGAQAISHAVALSHVRELSEIRVWGRNDSKADVVAGAIVDRISVPAARASRMRALQSDIVVTLTDAAAPLFDPSEIAPGSHVNLVGASSSRLCEAPPEFLRHGRWFADSRASVLEHAGEVKRALAIGIDANERLLGDLGQVLMGTIIGRKSAQDVTIFRSIGLGIEDIIASDVVYRASLASD